MLRWAVTAVMAVILVGAAMLIHVPRHTEQANNNDAADDALLLAVNNDIQRDYPKALAPAVIINDERNLVLSNNAANVSPEHEREQVR